MSCRQIENKEDGKGREVVTGPNRMDELIKVPALPTERPDLVSCLQYADDTPAPTETANVAAPRNVMPPTDLRKWFVLHTKSRQEKVVADFYRQHNVEHLLPLVSKTTYYGKRKIKSELPLFPGYVFIRGSAQDAYAADRTNRLVRIIPVFDQARIEEELRSLMRALRTDQPFDRHPQLVAGVRVEVKSGPLQGVRGVVESRLKCDRLILQVDILGQAISVEVDTDLLVILDDVPAVEKSKGGIRAA
ncbi:MAG: transcription termination/antitermination protein NusG [Phycisphaerae bacterium]